MPKSAKPIPVAGVAGPVLDNGLATQSTGQDTVASLALIASSVSQRRHYQEMSDSHRPPFPKCALPPMSIAMSRGANASASDAGASAESADRIEVPPALRSEVQQAVTDRERE